MSLQLSKQFLSRVLDHYRDAVLLKFPNRVLTPASITEMERFLVHYQSSVIKRETHPAWAIAIKLVFDYKHGVIDVVPDEQAGIEVV